MHMNNLSLFQAFWMGLNVERNLRGGPAVLYGEARDLWEEAMEALASSPDEAAPADPLIGERMDSADMGEN